MAESEFAQVRDYLEAASNNPLTSRGLLLHDNELYFMYLDLAGLQRDEAALLKYLPLVEETAVRDGHILHQANAHRARGVLHRLQGEYSAAKTRLNRALALFEELDTRWQIGRTLFELAELNRIIEDTTEAQDYFSRALVAFEEMGAVPDMARTQAALESFSRI